MDRGTIDAIRITPLAFADPPLLNAAGVHEPHVLRALVEIDVADGRGGTVTGLGECAGHAWQLDWLTLIAPRLLGTSVFDVHRLADRVDACLTGADVDTAPDAAWRRWSDRSPEASLGIAPIPAPAFDRRRVHAPLEVACHDAAGRLLGVRVVDLLGGARRESVEYAGYLFYKLAGHPDADGAVTPDAWGEALDAEGIVAQAEALVAAHGFASLKLKGGVFAPEVEVATIHALRRRFPAMPLRLDPNAAWSVPTAVAAAAQLLGVVEYLEDPVAGLEPMAEVARATGIPLATNMCVVLTEHLAPALRLGSVSIVLGDHHYWGGLRGTLALDAACHALGFGLSMHSNSHLGVSLAAMTHVCAASHVDHAADTHYPWNAADDIVAPGTLALVDGAVRLPDGPGLGVELDRAVVERLHRAYLDLGREHRQDERYAEALGVTSVTGPLPRW
ncbi:enolase C-terminal domain-like protein [Propioniciclava soli]|uniref:enolase C-terminal domain-like protein n=1 Tax=Propioniciclava soli TaxID=2775081 RepID=UPI002FCD2AEC